MRLHLILALVTGLLLFFTLRGERHRFTFARVDQMAQKRAALPYIPLPNVLPPQLQKLTPQQESGIFWKDAYRLWRKKGLPFQVDFYHISRSFPTGPQINTVDRKGPHRLAYSPTFFNFLNLAINPPLPSNMPFAGFYLRYPLPIALNERANELNGFFSVMGGSYYRALAKDQVYGLSARGLALNTGVAGKPEEFPEFTEWWLREPAANANEIVLDALLGSPSVSGAYEFKIRPGAQTSVDVRASLYFRRAVDVIGLAPFSSMYLYGENAKNHYGDTVHPEIHDSDGLLIDNGHGEWIWRPLEQTNFLQVYNFQLQSPRGFGLLQRDREFQHYQDLDMKYNVRPSVWVTPHGDWGKGVVQLTQLNSNNPNTDNVVMFWHPDAAPQAGSHLDISYTVDFYTNDDSRPPLASCRQTFVNDPAPPATPTGSLPPGGPVPTGKAAGKAVAAKGAKAAPKLPPPPPAPPLPKTTPVQFMVDFSGHDIESQPATPPPDLDLKMSPPGTILREPARVEKNAYDKSWRVTFTIFPAQPHVPTELSCRLLHNGRPLTETWTYTWHQ
jgi:glucans biosynthesis protein